MEAFRLGGAVTDHRHLNPMTGTGSTLEEIEGMVFDGWQPFLVETEWESQRISIDPIFRHHLMAEQRPAGTLGLSFAMSGFTLPAIELAKTLRPIRVFLFRASDIAGPCKTGWV